MGIEEKQWKFGTYVMMMMMMMTYFILEYIKKVRLFGWLVICLVFMAYQPLLVIWR